LGLAALGGRAEASGVIDITQVGANVVATGSGAFDLTDLGPPSLVLFSPVLDPATAFVSVGGSSFQFVHAYQGVTGPASFGTGGLEHPTSESGDIFGVVGGATPPELFVPRDYVSGSALSGSATYDGTTIAALGLTPGTYVYTWGAGAHADSLTVKIEAVPEPSTWATMLLGVAGLGFIALRGRTSTRAA
jgi:hypothetical protein